MSAIQKELVKLLDIDAPKKASERQDFLVSVVRGVTKLSDAAWNDMTPEAQNWFNSAVDARNAKADTLPDFPDFTDEEPPARRRASGDDSGDSKAGQTVEISAKDLKEGMPIALVTKRGKEDTGHVIEVTKTIVAIKQANGDEVEYELDRIEKLTTLKQAEEDAPRRRRAGGDDDGPSDPIKVGAVVKIKTKRGKEAEGEIIELDDELLVLKEGKDEVEYTRSSVVDIQPVGGGKEEGTTRRRSSGDDKGGKDTKDEGKQKRSSNEGVSVSTRIQELVLDDMKATEEEIGKALQKEGLEFRPNTLQINYKSTHKFLDALRERKMLK